MDDVFFILGCGRSGTTAMAHILNTASNAQVTVEQKPNLCIEARMNYEERLSSTKTLLLKSRSTEIENAHKQELIYGDKNPNYLAFIYELQEIWNPRFLYVHRDGRDVVRSMMSWNALQTLNGGKFFGMNEDDPNSDIFSPEQDWWDYSRIRPRPDEPAFENWKALSTFEQCAWHWAKYNFLTKEKLKQIDSNRWQELCMSKANAPEIENTFKFLGLNDFDGNAIQTILEAKINTYEFVDDNTDKYPHHSKWSKQQNSQFDSIANNVMQSLSY
jgi:hypothetical protein